MDFPKGVNPAQPWLTAENIMHRYHGLELIDPRKLGLKAEDVASVGTQMLGPINILKNSEITTWMGIDLRHINHSFDNNYKVFDLLAALAAGMEFLDQDIFDFLTCRDIPTAQLGSNLVALVETYRELVVFNNKDDYDLASAFAETLISDANNTSGIPLIGAYIFNHVPFEIVDETIQYDRMRMVVVESGIFVSIIAQYMGKTIYVPFYWTPEGINTSLVWLTPKGEFALDIMLACLWHDLKVVKTHISTKPELGRGGEFKSRSNLKPLKGNKVVIPRRIYISHWETGLDSIEPTVRAKARLHLVKHSYRYVGRHFPDADAIERARKFKKPIPPVGYTFVVPHKRGIGAAEFDALEEANALEIVWTGRDMAAMLLENRDK